MGKKYFLIICLCFVIGSIYGICLHKYKIFPYPLLKSIKSKFQNQKYGPWSIGFYKGISPFSLTSIKDINPILTGQDVTDRDAFFVADPFLIIDKNQYYLFFEVLDRKTHQGDIGYATSDDGSRWVYRKIILNEKFHLSYPYVFKWKNTFYMIPESNQDLSVRLYKAIDFPTQWKFVGKLLSGYRFLDPSIFRYNGMWWMFVATGESDTLNLYYSKKLENGWVAHPQNPIVKFNKHFARSGGRVIIINKKLYRFAQDDDPDYGLQVFAFEITKLTKKCYEEKLYSTKPILTGSGYGWNAVGMHHIDLHKVTDGWVAAVDGRSF